MADKKKFLDMTGLTTYTTKMKAYADAKAAAAAKGVTDTKGKASGIASLDTSGKLPTSQLPALKTVNGSSIVGSGNISIDLTLFKIADSLPTTGVDATKIYLVKSTASGTNNTYAEYIYTGDTSQTIDTAKWEKLGEYQSTIAVDDAMSTTSVNPVQNKVVNAALANKVDKVSGKALSTNDYTTEEKTKLAGIAAGATKVTVDTSLSTTSTNPVQNKVVAAAINGKVATNAVATTSALGLIKIGYTADGGKLPLELDTDSHQAYVNVESISDTDINTLFA